MTSAISGISAALSAISGIDATAGAPATTDVTAPAPASGGGFAAVLAGQVDHLNAVQGTADSLALQAATGDLKDAHDYMIASAEAKLATDTVVTLKNSAVAAFTEIMRMNI